MIGRRFRKYYKKTRFNPKAGWYNGTVHAYDPIAKFWQVKFDDGDEEEFEWIDLEHNLKRKTPLEEPSQRMTPSPPPQKRFKKCEGKRKAVPSDRPAASQPKRACTRSSGTSEPAPILATTFPRKGEG